MAVSACQETEDCTEFDIYKGQPGIAEACSGIGCVTSLNPKGRGHPEPRENWRIKPINKIKISVKMSIYNFSQILSVISECI